LTVACSSLADLGFTLAFSVEIGFKWGAFGFGDFFDDPWNILDFTCVVIGYVSLIPGGSVGGFSGLRSLRALRPLRTLNSVPSIKNLVATIFNSGKLLADVCLLIFFLIFLFSVVALQFFEGKMRYRCFSPAGTVTDPFTLCSTSLNNCPAGYECQETHHNPNHGFTNFDNAFGAILIIFTVMTNDTWASHMYKVMDVTSYMAFMYFVLIVLFLTIFALNLTAAILASRFTLARMEKAAKEEEDKELGVVEEELPETCFDRMTACFVWCFPPRQKEEEEEEAKWVISMRAFVEGDFFIHGTNFTMLIYVVILASMHKDPSDLWLVIFRYADLVMSVVFMGELTVKLIVHKWSEYFSSAVNSFDALVVMITFLSVWLVEAVGNLASLRMVRMLRVLQAARSLASFKSFWRVVGAVQHTFRAMLSFALLMLLVVFVYALLAMQFYGGKIKMEDFENSLGAPSPLDQYARVNFDTFFDSLITVFVALLGTWAATMWTCMYSVNQYTGAIFWMSLMAIGNCILLNLLLAVLIDNISQKKDMDAEEDDEDEKARKKQEEMDFNCRQIAKRLKTLKYTGLVMGQYEEEYDDLSDYEYEESHPDSQAHGGPSKQKRREAAAREMEEAETLGGDDVAEGGPPTEVPEAEEAEGEAAAPEEKGAGSGGGSGTGVGTGGNGGGSPSLSEGAGMSLSPKSPASPGDADTEALRQHLLTRLRDIQLLAKGVLDPNAAGLDALSSPKDFFVEKLLIGPSKTLVHVGGNEQYQSVQDVAEVLEQVKTKIDVPWYLILYRALTCYQEPSGSSGKYKKEKEEAKAPVPLEGNSLMCFGPENAFRKGCHAVAFHFVTETIVIILILASCVFLAMEEPALAEGSATYEFLQLMNYVLTGVFTIECLLKVIGLGLWQGEKAYLNSGWNVLDFVIVLISIMSLVFASAGVKALRSMRALRALRPLRLVSRLKGLKVVVDTIAEVLPQLVNVVLFTLIVWFFFGILGLHAFVGQYSRCNDPPVDMVDCVGTYVPSIGHQPIPRVWKTAHFNFDNIGASPLLSELLFDLTTQLLRLSVLCVRQCRLYPV